jgi:nucleoside-diphosphate-sugar epimerase
MITLVTGGNGFVGRALLMALVSKDVKVRAPIRRQHEDRCKDSTSKCIQRCIINDVGPATDWTDALDRVQTVVHLAARVHVMKENAVDPLAAFRFVNTLGTIRLASMAAQAGVQRFIYVSTIKVNGEATVDGAFHEDDAPQPSDPYAISKWEAEQALVRISAETGMEIVIIRPPLVYGPGVGGNFLTMLKWMDHGFPLPLASVDNQRSFVGLNNLVSLLMTCLLHPRAAGEAFLASDGEDLSTPELLLRTACALGKSPHLFQFPVSMLRMTARLLAKGEVCERLCGSLVVDCSKARRLLGWRPVSSINDELHRTAEWYHQHVAQIS